MGGVNMFGVDRGTVEIMRKQFPKGTRIVVDYMGNDPNPIAVGTKGTVIAVDDIGTLHCEFDNGRCLGLLYGEDVYHAEN